MSNQLSSSSNLTYKMKAATRRKYSQPSGIEIRNMNTPNPSDNEILVKVFATTVNRSDCANLMAKPFLMRFVLGFFKPKKIILGTDFAGEVVTTGKHVKSFSVGDRVLSFKDTGLSSQAEYLTISETDAHQIPAAIGYKQAVASLEGAHYAYSFIHKTKIESGQHILINGATGAIGSALLQFVKQYDVHISATCSTENIELIKSLGADKVYDYTAEDFTKSGKKYDHIFDAVGKSIYGLCKPILKKKGTYTSSELGPYAQNLFYSIILSKKVIFPVPDKIEKTIPYVISLLRERKFKPLIDRTYGLSDIINAYDYVLSGRKLGNVILDLSSTN